MLNDQQQHLLILFLDGEADARQRRAAALLLRENPEARRYLEALQRDAALLRKLPPATLPDHFADRIVGEIRARGLERQTPITILRPHFRPAWKTLAARAAVLFIVVGGGLWALATIRQHLVDPARHEVAVQPAASAPVVALKEPEKGGPGEALPPEAVAGQGRGDVGKDVAAALELAQSLRAVLAHGLSQWAENSRDLLAMLDAGGPGAVPATAEQDVLTARFNVSPAFKTMDLRLPLLAEFRNLEADKFQKRLKETNLQYLDLACVDSARALERFQTVCRAQGIKVLLDAEVSQRVAKRVPASFVVYLEGLPADRITKLVQALQAEDRKETKPKTEAAFLSLLLQPLDEPGRKWVAEALGIPAAGLMPPPPPRPGSTKPATPALDPTKPLDKDTAKSLERIVPGSAGKPPSKEVTAVVILNGPNRQRPPVSRELRQYLDSRPAAPSDAINMVVVLRTTR